MASYKLTYFDAKGRAEISRLLLTAAGKKFEDVRVKSEDWPKKKAGCPQGTMPVLEVGKLKLSQSLAIARYLARELGQYGKTNLEAAMIDQIMDTTLDLSGPFMKAAFCKDEAEKATLMKAFTEETAPKLLGFLENIVKEAGSGGFAVGKSFTVADAMLFSYIEMTYCVGLLDKFPCLKKNRSTVEALPKLKAYLASRPETAF